MASRTFGRRDLQRQQRQKARRGELTKQVEHWRPKTRGDCIKGPRPCAFVGCRYNLFLDITPKGGLRLPHGDDVTALERLPDTCALDIADRGPITLDMAAEVQGMTRERVRQIQLSAQENLKARTTDPDRGNEPVGDAAPRFAAAHEQAQRRREVLAEFLGDDELGD